MKHIPILFTAIGVFSLWSCVMEKPEPAVRAKHVVVIGFDGLSPDGIRNALTPNFDSIMSEGAWTLNARAVMPSSSSPNWASMIMGAGPEQHGITSNSWEKNNLVLPTVAQSEDHLFPSIFHLVDTQMENAEIGAIYHWTGFGRLFEKSAVDYGISPATEEETASLASAYIKEKKPTFTFVHFDHVDHAGHEYGHGSKEYYRSVEKADALLGILMDAIQTAGIAQETVVIISADHGGVGLGHGGESLKEMEIPFIVWGKGIKKNHSLTHPVYQYDNAATVAFALGLQQPMAWIGRPVKNAFEGFSGTDAYPTVVRLKKPLILPGAELDKKAGGLFDGTTEVAIENPNDRGSVKYTLDGSIPLKTSPDYTAPIPITTNTVVKSAIFVDGSIRSTVNEAFFRIKNSSDLPAVSYEVFYLDGLTELPSLTGKTPASVGKMFEITSDGLNERIKSNTVVRFTTNLVVDREDTYTFYTRSDDGSKLYIDGKEVVDNDGDHGVKENDGSLSLQPGYHSLEVLWFNGGGGGWLDVYYQSGTLPKQILSSNILKAN